MLPSSARRTWWKQKKSLALNMERGGCIYIMTNKYRTTLYIGVTSDLQIRILQHVNHDNPKSFTTKYRLNVCVYYEKFQSIEEAINREKELKGWKRSRKNALISETNPTWQDLWESEISEWT